MRSCERCMHFKQPQEKADMTSITASYPLELVHLDILMIGNKSDSSRNVNAACPCHTTSGQQGHEAFCWGEI